MINQGLQFQLEPFLISEFMAMSRMKFPILATINSVISAINNEIASNSSVISSPSPKKSGGGSTGASETEKERKARIKAELEKIETDHNAELTHIQKLYLEGAFESEEEYASAKIDLEKKYLGQKLEVVGLEAS